MVLPFGQCGLGEQHHYKPLVRISGQPTLRVRVGATLRRAVIRQIRSGPRRVGHCFATMIRWCRSRWTTTTRYHRGGDDSREATSGRGNYPVRPNRETPRDVLIVVVDAARSHHGPKRHADDRIAHRPATPSGVGNPHRCERLAGMGANSFRGKGGRRRRADVRDTRNDHDCRGRFRAVRDLRVRRWTVVGLEGGRGERDATRGDPGGGWLHSQFWCAGLGGGVSADTRHRVAADRTDRRWSLKLTSEDGVGVASVL
ncbi:hypothetical protein GA0061091_12444 [Gordonia sp. v-85]|nr:hypothetical protein GA0061091_12444 [Gordonia sp. v-85]